MKRVMSSLYYILVVVISIIGVLGFVAAIQIKFWSFLIVVLAASLIQTIFWKYDNIFAAVRHLAKHFFGTIGLCSLLAIVFPQLSKFPMLWILMAVSVLVYNIIEVCDYIFL